MPARVLHCEPFAVKYSFFSFPPRDFHEHPVKPTSLFLIFGVQPEGHLSTTKATQAEAHRFNFDKASRSTMRGKLTKLFWVIVVAASFSAHIRAKDQGSVLVYNLYASRAVNDPAQNTRISITNTHETTGVAVHLFFVDGTTCQVTDAYLCLAAQQTAAFLASEPIAVVPAGSCGRRCGLAIPLEIRAARR